MVQVNVQVRRYEIFVKKKHIFVCRLNGFPLDSCQLLASSLLNLIHNCYWRGIQNDGCVSADENELAEACLETLSVSKLYGKGILTYQYQHSHNFRVENVSFTSNLCCVFEDYFIVSYNVRGPTVIRL